MRLATPARLIKPVPRRPSVPGSGMGVTPSAVSVSDQVIAPPGPRTWFACRIAVIGSLTLFPVRMPDKSIVIALCALRFAVNDVKVSEKVPRGLVHDLVNGVIEPESPLP